MLTRTNAISFLSLGLGSGVVGALVAAATLDTESKTPPSADPVIGEARLASFRSDLIEELRETWSSERPVQLAARVAVPEVDRDQVAAVVRELLEQGEVAGQRPGEEDSSADAMPEITDELPSPEDFLALIDSLPEGDPRARELWERASEMGQLDAILAAYESSVADAPNDPTVNVAAARGFLAAAQQQPNHPEGLWWRRSDELYGTTLELDPNHWEARMEKAVNLTFWPDMYGRKKEAIGHFETLISQAEKLPAEERHARAYVLLGNMLQQNGDDEQAQQVWNRGLARHPGNSTLAGKLGR